MFATSHINMTPMAYPGLPQRPLHSANAAHMPGYVYSQSVPGASPWSQPAASPSRLQPSPSSRVSTSNAPTAKEPKLPAKAAKTPRKDSKGPKALTSSPKSAVIGPITLPLPLSNLIEGNGPNVSQLLPGKFKEATEVAHGAISTAASFRAWAYGLSRRLQGQAQQFLGLGPKSKTPEGLVKP
jgi:hypothetical protein